VQALLQPMLGKSNPQEKISSTEFVPEMITENRFDVERRDLPVGIVETPSGKISCNVELVRSERMCFNFYMDLDAANIDDVVPTHVHVPVKTATGSENKLERSESSAHIRLPVKRHSVVVNGPSYAQKYFPYLRVTTE